jgi:hypothetical protein
MMSDQDLDSQSKDHWMAVLSLLPAYFSGRKWLTDNRSGQVIDVASKAVQYFPVPKVACSSLMTSLADVLGIAIPSDEWVPEIFQTHKWDHLYAREEVVLTKRAALKKEGRWRFAFVRNPWDRLVSCYSEKIREDGDSENFVDGISKVLVPYGVFRGGMTFDAFVDATIAIPDEKADPHWRSQYTFLVDRFDRLAMDFVGRFESFDDDVRRVADRLHSNIRPPHLLASKRMSYPDYYTARTRHLVSRRYARDIATFGYAFD